MNNQETKAGGTERRTMWQKIDRWAWRNDHMAIAEFASRRIHGMNDSGPSSVTRFRSERRSSGSLAA